MNKSVSVDKKKKSNTQVQASPISKKTQPKSQKKSHTQEYTSLEEFEENIMDINLNKPRTAKQLFISSCYEGKWKGKDMIESIKEVGQEWFKLTDKQKKKFLEESEKEKGRYAEHLALVRKHLVNKPVKESATAYFIYLDEAVKEAIDNLQNIKEARVKAKESWRNLSDAEKQKWEEKKEENKDIYDKLSEARPGNVTAYALFVKDQINNYKKNGKSLTFKQVAERWAKTKDAEKEKYQEYANELKEEKEKLRDLYEITFGIKPKRPLGSFNLFIQEFSKKMEGSKKNLFKEASLQWSKTSEEEKAKFEKIFQRNRLVYIVKKIEFNNHKRTTYKRAPSAFNIYLGDKRGELADKDMDNQSSFEYIGQQWKKETDATKKKYMHKAEEAKEEYKQDKEDYESRKFRPPTRAKTPYNLYLIDRMAVHKEKNPNMPTTEIFGKIAEEWAQCTEKKKEEYNKKSEPLQEEYKRQLKEFKNNHYYTPGKTITDTKMKRDTKSESRSKSKTKKKKE